MTEQVGYLLKNVSGFMWKIPYFLDFYHDEISISSPYYHHEEGQWYVEITFNERKLNVSLIKETIVLQAKENFRIYLVCKNYEAIKKLQLKKISSTNYEHTYDFKSISMQTIIRKSSGFLPSGILTIICKLKAQNENRSKFDALY